jgi:pyruvate dehydrogenase E1 component alpha subunit
MDLTKDRMITAYRNHVQPIGMGVDPKRVAELWKSYRTSKGMGGSMHIFKEHRFYGGHGIVGGQIPVGAGSFNILKQTVTLTYFDGAAHRTLCTKL